MTPKKIAAFAVGPLGGAFLGLITLPIIAWLFSQEDVGRLSMLQVVMGFSILLFSFGLDQSYVREYHEVDDKPKLLKHAIYPGLLVISVMVISLLILGVSLSELTFGIESSSLNILIVITLISSFLSRFLSLILRMQERGLAYSMSQLLPKLVLVLIIVTYILFDSDRTLINLITAYTASIFVVFIVYVWNTRMDWLPALFKELELSRLNNMLAFGVPLIFGGLAFWGLTAVDKIFLRTLTSFDELAIYSVSVSFAAAATVMKSVFSTVWIPIVYKWANQGEGIEKIEKVMNYVLTVVVLAFCATALLSWCIDYILPPDYLEVKWIVISCIGYPLLYLLSETTVVGIGIKRKSSYSMLAAILALIVNLIGNWLTIPEYGARGAAASTCLSFWAFFILRTEFSILCWKPFRRWRLYSMSTTCLVLSMISSLFGSSTLFFYILLLWAAFLVIACLVFYVEIKNIIRFTQKSFSTKLGLL